MTNTNKTTADLLNDLGGWVAELFISGTISQETRDALNTKTEALLDSLAEERT